MAKKTLLFTLQDRGQTISVYLVKDLAKKEGFLGTYSDIANEVCLDAEIPQTRKIAAFWHEICHALCEDEYTVKHGTIARIGRNLSALLLANPDILEKLRSL
jgi:hypothetical protein